MKKMKGIRKLLALILTLAMVSGMVSAYADELCANMGAIFPGDVDGNLTVVVDNGDLVGLTTFVDVEGNLNGNLTVENSVDGKTAECYVNGKITENVTVSVENGGVALASPRDDVGGNVTITAETGGFAKLYQQYEDVSTFDMYDIGGSALLTATGGGEAKLTSGNVKDITATATGVSGSDPDEASTVIVVAQDTGAVVSNVSGGGKVDITVDDVTVTSDTESVTGISINQGSNVDGQGSNTVKADSVSATTTGDYSTATGVQVQDGTAVIGDGDEGTSGEVVLAEASGNNVNAIAIDAAGESAVTVKGDVKAETVVANEVDEDNKSYGINASGNSNVAVSGDVTATIEMIDGGTFVSRGINASGNSIVVISGDVTATTKISNYFDGFTDGIYASGNSNVTVSGDVTAAQEGSKYSVGIKANDNAKVVISKGSVEAQEQGIHIEATQSNGRTIVDVEDGNVETTANNSEGIYIRHYNQGNATVRVAGDVQSTGIGLDLGDDNGGDADILIEGTLSGDHAISLSTFSAADITTLTTWKAESTNGGEIVGTLDAEEKFAAAINYIVKLSGIANSDITTAKHNTVAYDETDRKIIYGDETAEKAEYKYHTANEEEEVTVNVKLQDGEVFEGIYYNAEGTTDAEKNLLTVTNGGLTAVADAMNSFVLKMQRGGGMLLGLKTHTHEFTVYQSTVTKPTCTTTGTDIYKCAYCDATTTKTVAVNPDNHTLANGQAKAVTCTEDGWAAYQYCTQCDYSTKVVIPAGHDFSVNVPAKAVTCTEDGYTAHKECSRCHEKNDAYQVIKAKGHTEVIDKAVEPTCTKTGLTEGKHCSACNEVLVAQEVVKAKGHTEVIDKAVEPTCTKTGLTEGKHCSVCGAVIVAQTTVAAKGHTPAAAVKENEKAAQVGMAGSYDEVVYCETCGAELSRKTVTTDPLPEPEPEPKPEPEPEIVNTVTYYTLSFYEDAESMVNEVKVKAGGTYTLPTPVREGKTFVGWAVSDVPPTDPSWVAPAEGDASILAAGTEYKVTENKSFVGIWK